jgi:hypothetical protein
VTLDEALAKAERVFDEQIQILVADALARLQDLGATADELAAERTRIDQEVDIARREVREVVYTAWVTDGEQLARFQ